MEALMKECLKLAVRASVVKRALKYALVVGCFLITINHGDAILRGEVGFERWTKMLMTTFVPYMRSQRCPVLVRFVNSAP